MNRKGLLASSGAAALCAAIATVFVLRDNTNSGLVGPVSIADCVEAWNDSPPLSAVENDWEMGVSVDNSQADGQGFICAFYGIDRAREIAHYYDYQNELWTTSNVLNPANEISQQVDVVEEKIHLAG